MIDLGRRAPIPRDAAELRRLIGVHGVTGAARTLGCSPSTLRDHARRLGIPPLPPGPRRGQPRPTKASRLDIMLAQLRGKLADDQRMRNLAPALLAERVRAVHHAHQARDAVAFEAALLELASIALLTRERSIQQRHHARQGAAPSS